MRGSREISLVPSLHRASTDALIIWQNPDIHVSGSPMNPYHITLTIFHGLHDATDVHANCNINKWKNHFYEMKGDVGMSLHEKERNKKMPT